MRRHKLPTETFLESAQRQLNICNACRYCEGYCAVFPALELRSTFTEADVTYLANLCHDCRACLDACMYAPPHEFGVDIPATLRTARDAGYVRYAWPHRLATLLWHHPRASVAVATLGGFVAALVAESANGRSLVAGRSGPGSFYTVIPWLGMVLAFGLAALFIIAVVSGAIVTFWRSGTVRPRKASWGAAWRGVIADVVPLRYLGGGGPGCPYPDPDRPSHGRRLLHQAVLYGFLLDFASTCVAAIYQDILHRMPPYPVTSLPVLLGIIGGVGVIAGCTGLLHLRYAAWRLRHERPAPQDVSFVAVLNLVAITGMILLILRATPAMPILLDLHLASVFALFLTLPYSRFVHAAYRVAALLRNRLEEAAQPQLGAEDEGVAA